MSIMYSIRSICSYRIGSVGGLLGQTRSSHVCATVVRCPQLWNRSSNFGYLMNIRAISQSFHQSRYLLLINNSSEVGRKLFKTNLISCRGRTHINVTRLLNTASNVGKATNSKAPKSTDVKRLLSLASPERWRIAAAIFFLFISSGVTMAVPFGIGRVIDIIYSSDTASTAASLSNEEINSKAPPVSRSDRLDKFCAVLLTVFVCGAAANFTRVYLLQTSANRIIHALRNNLFKSVLKQDIAFFDKNRTGELINRLSSDASLVGQVVTTNVSDGLRSMTQTLGGVTMMIVTSPKLALVALGIVPPVALLSRIYGRYTRRVTQQVQDALAGATQVAEERIANVRTVRAFVGEEREAKRYQVQTSRVLDLSQREALARGFFWAGTGLSGNIIVLSVMYAGGTMLGDAQITVGVLSSFLLYAAFVGVSIGSLGTFYTELMRGIGASTRLWQLVDRKPDIPISGGIIPSNGLSGNLEFRDITFTYPTRPDNVILEGLNLVLSRGSVTAVVGPSGSGKSTIAALLLRYYDPTSGRILVDNTNVKDLDASWLRNQIGVVPQEPILFSTSIAENIAYGATNPESVTTEELIRAARTANAYDFIQSFTDGFDTVVGERGVMLSGGQRQRIAIARAIIKNPSVLLLDEATSALDAESEGEVRDALERVMVGRTVMVIAHRLSTIRSADQIVVLERGKVVERGGFSDLMKIQGGLFRRLVDRQAVAS